MSDFFDQYAEWTETVAKYPPTAEPFYLALGIADEVAEVFQKEHPEDVIKELGDVCWYLARYVSRVCFMSFSDFINFTQSVPGAEEYLVIVEVGRIAGVEKKRIRDGHLWDEDTKDAKRAIALNACYHIALWIDAVAKANESTFHEVLLMNMQKLNTRNENNTIQGDGDNR